MLYIEFLRHNKEQRIYICIMYYVLRMKKGSIKMELGKVPPHDVEAEQAILRINAYR